MKPTEVRIGSSLTRTLLVSVIACLCFSAGEGLRLTPFPVSAVTRASGPQGLLSASQSRKTSPEKYGPLTVPRQTQTRKRSDTGIDGLPPQTATDLRPPHLYVLAASDEPTCFASLLFSSRARDRAPPPSLAI